MCDIVWLSAIPTFAVPHYFLGDVYFCWTLFQIVKNSQARIHFNHFNQILMKLASLAWAHCSWSASRQCLFHAVPLVSWHRGKLPVVSTGPPWWLDFLHASSCTHADDQDFRSIPIHPTGSHSPVLFSTCHVHHQNTVQHVYDIDIYIYMLYEITGGIRRVYQVLQHVYEATNVRAGRDHKGPMVRHSPSYTWLYLGTW
jgi:hypothetical protein